MPLKKSELHSSLWASCDELRDGTDAMRLDCHPRRSRRQTVGIVAYGLTNIAAQLASGRL